MGFLDDLFNGGIDRNLDGNIDEKDRKILEEEESVWNSDSDRRGYYERREEYDDYDDEGNLRLDEYGEPYDEDDYSERDEDDEDDYSERDEDDEDDGFSSITTQVIRKKNTHTDKTNKKTGVWVYYDEEYDKWDFKRALFDKFPETEKDYGKFLLVETVFENLYEDDKEKAIECLLWLWENFPVNLFTQRKSDKKSTDFAYESRGAILKELLRRNVEDKFLYELFKENEKVFNAAFVESSFETHGYDLIYNYMELALNFEDVDAALKGYQAYLDNQNNGYTLKDLGDLWDKIVRDIYISDLSLKKQKAIYSRFLPLVEKTAPYGKKALKEILSKLDCEFAQPKYNSRIDSSFIKRDFDAEKELGVDDIKFYCYWMPDSESTLIINGEIISKERIKAPFCIKAKVCDEDGDLIKLERNCSYYGIGEGAFGFPVPNIYPEVFFNRYPFTIRLEFADKKIPHDVILSFEIDDERPLERISNTVNVNSILEKATTVEPLYLAKLDEGDKIPPKMINYYVEQDLGVEEIKCTYIKEHESTDEYRANQVTYFTTVKGRIKNDLLIYHMFYNEKDELIEYSLQKVDKTEKRKEKNFEHFFGLPASEKIAKIIVYVGTHPFILT